MNVKDVEAQHTENFKHDLIYDLKKFRFIGFGLILLSIPAVISLLLFTTKNTDPTNPNYVLGLEATGFSLFGLPAFYYFIYLAGCWVSLWLIPLFFTIVGHLNLAELCRSV
jgi:hypothetical protein